MKARFDRPKTARRLPSAEGFDVKSRLLRCLFVSLLAWECTAPAVSAEPAGETASPFRVSWEPAWDNARPAIARITDEVPASQVAADGTEIAPPFDPYQAAPYRSGGQYSYSTHADSSSGYYSAGRNSRGYGYSPLEIFPVYGGDPSLSGVRPVSDPDPKYGYLVFFNYEAFRGVPDGNWSNFGLDTGVNAAYSLGRFSDWTGIGAQAGASIGVFDWAGTDYRLQNQGSAETQGYFTYGLFRRPTENSRISAGVVQDWSINRNFSVFSQSPTLSQIRSQIGYATSASNDYGVWGTVHVINSTHNVPIFGPVTWQSVNQISGYWHHKWTECGADTWLSVGAPANTRLSGNGSLGDYLVTVAALSPLSDVVSLNASATYMHQSGGQGGAAAREDAWNFMVGVNIYPMRNARSRTVAGQRWMPLMPVANNGSFLVDASQNY